MSYRIICQLIAAATLLTLLANWPVFSYVATVGQGGIGFAMGALSLATLAIALASVAGMWKARKWGFVAFYLFGVLYAVLFGASLIPFLPLLIPEVWRVAGVFVLNGIVLALVGLVHWKHPG